MDGDEKAIFAEINSHGRSTEQKQISVAFAYVALVGVAAGAIPDFVVGGTWSAGAAAVVLFVLGLVVFRLTLIYRSWKVHYMKRTRVLAGDDWINGGSLPMPAWPSADFTIAATVGLVVIAVGTLAGSNVAAASSEAVFSQWTGAVLGLIASVGIVVTEHKHFTRWTRWRDL
ncbi:MAG TPA: hypothetical protein VG872_00980 [Acidimicrobiia bacterium]|nr:hypothetical protein [Acidimicrobiia bacterium]